MQNVWPSKRPFARGGNLVGTSFFLGGFLSLPNSRRSGWRSVSPSVAPLVCSNWQSSRATLIYCRFAIHGHFAWLDHTVQWDKILRARRVVDEALIEFRCWKSVFHQVKLEADGQKMRYVSNYPPDFRARERLCRVHHRRGDESERSYVRHSVLVNMINHVPPLVVNYGGCRRELGLPAISCESCAEGRWRDGRSSVRSRIPLDY